MFNSKHRKQAIGNYNKLDEGMANVILGQDQEAEISVALSQDIDLGGYNAVLSLKKWMDA